MNYERFLILNSYPPLPGAYPFHKALIDVGYEVVSAGPKGWSPISDEEFETSAPECRHIVADAEMPLASLFDRIGWMPDAVFHLMASAMIFPSDLEFCPVPTVYTYLHYGRDASYMERRFYYYDSFLMPDHADVYPKYGYDNQATADRLMWFPPWHRPAYRTETRTIDVAFIGSLKYPCTATHRRRNRLMARVRRLAGEGIQTLVTDGVAYSHIHGMYSRAKIVLEHSTEARHLTHRTMDALWAGAMVIAPRQNEAERSPLNARLEDRRHIAYFDDDAEALELIRHYLEHDAEREAIAEAGRAFVHEYAGQVADDLSATLIEDCLDLIPPDFFEKRKQRLERFGVDYRRRCLDLAHLYYNSAKTDRAKASCESIPNWDTDPHVMQCHALSAAYSGDIETYQRDLDEIRAIHPNHPFSQFNHAILSFEKRLDFGLMNAIEETRRALISLQQADPATWQPEAATGFYARSPSQMERFLMELDEICYTAPPGRKRSIRVHGLCAFQLHRNFGIMLSEQGGWQQAYQALSVSERIIADDAMTLLHLARCHVSSGRVHEAIAYCRRALDADPFYMDAVPLLVGLLVRSGKGVEAIELLENVLLIHTDPDEDRLSLFINIGQVCVSLDQRDAAISALTDGLNELRTGRVRVGGMISYRLPDQISKARLAELEVEFVGMLKRVRTNERGQDFCVAP